MNHPRVFSHAVPNITAQPQQANVRSSKDTSAQVTSRWVGRVSCVSAAIRHYVLAGPGIWTRPSTNFGCWKPSAILSAAGGKISCGALWERLVIEGEWSYPTYIGSGAPENGASGEILCQNLELVVRPQGRPHHHQ